MKYFAKYIPVKEKVKLFLCSRDIQVGDEITNSNYYNTSLKVDELPLRKAYKNWYKIIGEISSDATWVKEGDEFTEDQIKAYFSPKIVPYEQWKSYAVTGYRKTTNTKQTVYPLSETFSNSVWEIPINSLTHKYKIKGPCGHYH